jgi:hypothetical protein
MNGNEDTLPVTVQHTVQTCEISRQNEAIHARPPNPSGKRALTIAGIALLSANWNQNSNLKMVLGAKMDTKDV